MRINKEIRQLSREMLRASFTDGELDRGKIAALVFIRLIYLFMVPMLGWLIPIPFYFMELLVGIVQALVFMLLTAVFTLLIAQHEPGHEAHH